MPQLKLSVSGLATNTSHLNNAPGALKIAKNVCIDSPNVATSRRGFYKPGWQITLGQNKRINSIFELGNDLFAQYSDGNIVKLESNYTLTSYTTDAILPDAELGFQSFQAQKTAYFTTTKGIKKINGSAVRLAGIIKPLAGKTAFVGSGNWFTDNKQVAYRIVYKYTDSQEILHLSEPSERIEVINTEGHTESVQITIPLPAVLTTDYYVQLYRSYLSADQNTIAADNMYLAQEYQIQAGDLTAGYCVLTDTTEQNSLGATLYTSANQEGINAALVEPPYAKTVCFYSNYAFFGNIKQKQFIQMQMTKPSVMQNDDTLTIGGITYTAKASESVGSRQFHLFATGTESTDAENTMRSLEYIINRDASATVYAIYVKNYSGGFGNIVFRAKTYDQAAFNVACSRAGIFTPEISSTVTSENDERKNRVYYSHEFLPDGVPYLNYFDVGDRNAAIIGMIPLRESILIFNDRQEIWRVSGYNEQTFQLDQYDTTIQLFGTKTLQYIDNRLYCFSNQGVIEISDNGKQLKSFEIDDELSPFLSVTSYPNFKTTCCSIGYETDRKYFLVNQNKIYVFNFLTGAWTTWEIEQAENIHCAFVRSFDDRIYFFDSDGYVWKERKDFLNSDYCDDNIACTVVSRDYTVPSVTLSALPAGTAIGDGILQGMRMARIVAINGAVLTLNTVLSWQPGAALIVKAIDCQIEYQPLTGGNPQMMKRFIETVLYFKNVSRKFTIYFANNFQGSYDSVDVTPTALNSTWGSGEWGNIPWGGESVGNLELRRYFPLRKQRGLYAIIKIRKTDLFSSFSFVGLAILFTETGNRFRGVGDAV